MENWSIYLSSAASETTFTDINGNYSFTNLQTGTYTISEEQRSGWEQTFPVSPNTYSVTLSAGQDTTGFDFGNVQLFTITASAERTGVFLRQGQLLLETEMIQRSLSLQVLITTLIVLLLMECLSVRQQRICLIA